MRRWLSVLLWLLFVAFLASDWAPGIWSVLVGEQNLRWPTPTEIVVCVAAILIFIAVGRWAAWITRQREQSPRFEATRTRSGAILPADCSKPGPETEP
jgi:hypothetical protein